MLLLSLGLLLGSLSLSSRIMFRNASHNICFLPMSFEESSGHPVRDL